MYESIRQLYSPCICKTNRILARDSGTVVTEKQEVAEQWLEHFSDSLNTEEIECDNLTCPVTEHPVSPPWVSVDAQTIEEVQEAVSQLHSSKSPGPDTIPAEILKDGGGLPL